MISLQASLSLPKRAPTLVPARVPGRPVARALFSVLSLFLLAQCSTVQQKSSESGHPFEGPTSGIETLVILGTNDLHGAVSPLKLQTVEKPGTPSISYEAAGLATLSSYIHRLRDEFGEHLLWLDGGDQFQGTIESNLEFGAPMVKFFNSVGLNAAAIGNHEFDFGVDHLEDRMRQAGAHYPYLAANILKKGTQNLAGFPNTLPSTMLKAGKLNVGVIGLSTIDTPSLTRAVNVVDYDFTSLKRATLQEATSLREKGAQLVVIVAHAGLSCSQGRSTLGKKMRKATDPQGECDMDEIVQLLQSLPAGTVDAVVSGHTHKVVHHWVAGVPVIQGGMFGQYTNVVYLSYDWAEQKVVRDLTRIEGPIPICSKVFQNQGDCDGERAPPPAGRGSLVPSKFHGVVIRPDSSIEKLLAAEVKRSEEVKGHEVGYAERSLLYFKTQESPLGNLVADALREATHSDFAIINPGGVRHSLEIGPIHFEEVFRSLPFENLVATIKVNASELIALMRAAQNGRRGFGSISGMRLKLIDLTNPTPTSDVNQDGMTDPWEVDRLLEVTFPDGKQLDSQKMYTIAMSDFMAQGGDDLSWVVDKLPANRFQMNAGISVRKAVLTYLAKHSPVNTLEHPSLDPTKPRLILAKGPIKKARGKKATKKKK